MRTMRRYRSPDSGGPGKGVTQRSRARAGAGDASVPASGAEPGSAGRRRPGARGTQHPPLLARPAALASPPAPRGWSGGREEVGHVAASRLGSTQRGRAGGGAGDRRSSPLAFERSSWANGRRGDAPGLVQALC